jgi:hypothetical protein
MHHFTTFYQPPIAASRVPVSDPAMAPWLDASCAVPSGGTLIWQLWLPREVAARLLSDLDRHAIAARLAGEIEERGVWLYVWPSMPNPSLQWLLRSYAPGAALVSADTPGVGAGSCWACGKALARLLAAALKAQGVGA